jgi:hypothetical protein
MYKLLPKKQTPSGLVDANVIQRIADNAFIPFDESNTDYAQFKKAIIEETAELQDADGDTMTAAEAKAYIATLP